MPLRRGTHRSGEAALDAKLVTFLNGNVAAKCLVASVDILTVLFERIDSPLHGDVRKGYAISALLNDFHAGGLK